MSQKPYAKQQRKLNWKIYKMNHKCKLSRPSKNKMAIWFNAHAEAKTKKLDDDDNEENLKTTNRQKPNVFRDCSFIFDGDEWVVLVVVAVGSAAVVIDSGCKLNVRTHLPPADSILPTPGPNISILQHRDINSRFGLTLYKWHAHENICHLYLSSLWWSKYISPNEYRLDEKKYVQQQTKKNH